MTCPHRTHLQLPTRRQIPQHEELKPVLRPNPHPRHPSPQLLRAIRQDPPDADPERCPQQGAPFIRVHAELQPGVGHEEPLRDVLEQVAHDGAGVGVGDVIVGEVAEPVRGLVVAGFLPPERPDDVGPAVQRRDVAVRDLLAGGFGLAGAAEAGFDFVGGAADILDDDGGDGGDEGLLEPGLIVEFLFIRLACRRIFLAEVLEGISA